jgi:transcriptional regulator NrdR family protein
MSTPRTYTTPAPESGIACRCGSFDLRGYSFRRYHGRIVRERDCQVCGHRVRTVERAEGHAKQKKGKPA